MPYLTKDEKRHLTIEHMIHAQDDGINYLTGRQIAKRCGYAYSSLFIDHLNAMYQDNIIQRSKLPCPTPIAPYIYYYHLDNVPVLTQGFLFR